MAIRLNWIFYYRCE